MVESWDRSTFGGRVGREKGWGRVVWEREATDQAQLELRRILPKFLHFINLILLFGIVLRCKLQIIFCCMRVALPYINNIRGGVSVVTIRVIDKREPL